MIHHEKIERNANGGSDLAGHLEPAMAEVHQSRASISFGARSDANPPATLNLASNEGLPPQFASDKGASGSGAQPVKDTSCPDSSTGSWSNLNLGNGMNTEIHKRPGGNNTGAKPSGDGALPTGQAMEQYNLSQSAYGTPEPLAAIDAMPKLPAKPQPHEIQPLEPVKKPCDLTS